jgi:hypothetical protein
MRRRARSPIQVQARERIDGTDRMDDMALQRVSQKKSPVGRRRDGLDQTHRMIGAIEIHSVPASDVELQ